MTRARPFSSFFSLSAARTFERIFSSGKKFLLMTQLWKWKCRSAWLMSLSLTPNGKNPTTRPIFWTLYFFHPNSHSTLWTYTAHYHRSISHPLALLLLHLLLLLHTGMCKHRDIFCISSWLSNSLNLSYSLPSLSLSVPRVTLNGSCQWSS